MDVSGVNCITHSHKCNTRNRLSKTRINSPMTLLGSPGKELRRIAAFDYSSSVCLLLTTYRENDPDCLDVLIFFFDIFFVVSFSLRVE